MGVIGGSTEAEREEAALDEITLLEQINERYKGYKEFLPKYYI